LSFRYNVVRWTRFDRGGHFAALEEPALLAEDLRHFVRILGSGDRPSSEL
jgi:hypothetical protein